MAQIVARHEDIFLIFARNLMLFVLLESGLGQDRFHYWCDWAGRRLSVTSALGQRL